MKADIEDRIASLARLAPPKQVEAWRGLASALGISEAAAIAVQLCREAMNEWCPVEDHGKVIAALFGLENARRTGLGR